MDTDVGAFGLNVFDHVQADNIAKQFGVLNCSQSGDGLFTSWHGEDYRLNALELKGMDEGRRFLQWCH